MLGPVRFLNVLADHEHFLQAVQVGWQSLVQGKPMFKLWTHLKQVKTQLKL